MAGARGMPWNFHTCYICPYRSKSTFVMWKHARLHRTRSINDTFICDSKTPELFQCESCVFVTSLKVVLTEHFRVSHEGKEANEEIEKGYKPMCCRNCDFKTHSMLVLVKHADGCNRMVKHKEKELSTTRNDKPCQFTTFTSLGVRWYKCKRCGFKTVRRKYITIHLSYKHLPKNEDINRFKGEQHVMQKRIEPRKKWFNCAHCAYKTGVKCRLVGHIFKTHRKGETNWFNCTQCSYKSDNKHTLQGHILRRHINLEHMNWLNSENVGCNIKVKSNSSGVRTQNELSPTPDDKWYEIKSSEGDRWCECKHCAYKTTHMIRMRDHILNKHVDSKEIKWVKCRRCEFKCTDRYNLKIHTIEEHTKPEDVKWFECDQCVFKSIHRGSLRQHIQRKHTNSEEQCPHCPFKTLYRNYLKRHVARHNQN